MVFVSGFYTEILLSERNIPSWHLFICFHVKILEEGSEILEKGRGINVGRDNMRASYIVIESTERHHYTLKC